MTNSHRTCTHPTTSSARATCRRERAAAADALRAEYAHVLGRRILFHVENCDVCPRDDYHTRHYGVVRDVTADPRYPSDPNLHVWDEATMSLRLLNVSEAYL